MMERFMPSFPSWGRTTDHILTFRSDELSQERFARLAQTNTPCVIRGAARDWPAVQKWTPDYLAKNCNLDARAWLYKKPVVHEWGYLWAKEPPFKPEGDNATKARDFFSSEGHAVTRIEFPPLDPKLLRDLENFAFPFRPDTPGTPTLQYTTPSCYLYRGGSFTDWHAHTGFDAFMCQVRGAKDVMLLPPTADVWRALAPALDDHDNSFDIPRGKYPDYEKLRPTLVRVEAGDVIFLPAWWWHCVEAVDKDFGVTVPHWWDSQWQVRFDPTVPHVDHIIWKALPSAMVSRYEWSTARSAQFRRALMLAAVFASPLPWISLMKSGSRFGRRPKSV
jgi:hypothetical protein